MISKRSYNGNRSYPIPVWNGLLEHRERVRSAIWVYLWCLDKITTEDRSIGVVLGGAPVKAARIAHDLKESPKTAERQLRHLVRGGYVIARRTPYGLVLSVTNSRKFGIWSKKGTDKIVNEDERQDRTAPEKGKNSPVRQDTNVRSKEDSAINSAIDATGSAQNGVSQLLGEPAQQDTSWKGADQNSIQTRFTKDLKAVAAQKAISQSSSRREELRRAIFRRAVTSAYFDGTRGQLSEEVGLRETIHQAALSLTSNRAVTLRGLDHKELLESVFEEDARRAAEKLLKARLDQIVAERVAAKPFIGPGQERVLVHELLDALEADLKLRQVGGLKGIQSHLKQLRIVLGSRRAIDITTEVVDRYIETRLLDAEPAAPATVNRETGLLVQAFKLGIRRQRISGAPEVRRLSEKGNARQGFFEKPQFDELLKHLPGNLKGFVKFGYYSGWRKGEIGSLEWSDVDIAGRVIRLQLENSKTREGRVLVLDGELWSVIAQQWTKREYKNGANTIAISRFVFHRYGGPIREFRKAWSTACVAAGLGRMVCAKCDSERRQHSPEQCEEKTRYVGKIFHDFRRTAIRNRVRAGVPERVAMAVSGHKTRSIFDRYNIVNEDDLRTAMVRTQAYLKATPASTIAFFPAKKAAAAK